MSDKNNSTTGGIGFFELLTIVFIVLKLTNVITWSWVWVLAPILISIVVRVVRIVLEVLIDSSK